MFKSKCCKYAYKKGIQKGNKGGKVWQKGKKQTAIASKKKVNAPIYDYSKFFDFTPSGRIKGSYVDGIFEPD